MLQWYHGDTEVKHEALRSPENSFVQRTLNLMSPRPRRHISNTWKNIDVIGHVTIWYPRCHLLNLFQTANSWFKVGYVALCCTWAVAVIITTSCCLTVLHRSLHNCHILPILFYIVHIDDVTIRLAICNFLLVVHWNRAWNIPPPNVCERTNQP